MCAAHPQLSILIQGQGGPPPLPLSVCAHAPLLSAFPPQLVKPPLQPSAINPPPLPQILAFTLQRDVSPLQTLFACAPPPLLSVLLQGRVKTPLLPSTMHVYVPLISALLLRKVMPLHQPSSEPAPLPRISAFPPQQGVPPLYPLAVRDYLPPPLSVSLQWLGVPPLLPSDVCAYARLLW